MKGHRCEYKSNFFSQLCILRLQTVSKKVKISRSLFKLLYPERADESNEPYDSDEDEYGEEGEIEEVPMKEILIDGVPTLVRLTSPLSRRFCRWPNSGNACTRL